MGACACTGKVGHRGDEPPEVIKRAAISNALPIQRNHRSVHDAYVVDRGMLGEGGFGKVYRVTNRKSGEAHAMKVLSKLSGRDIERCKREADFTQSMDHPNIVRLVETFESVVRMHLVLELCEGGELFARMLEDKCFDEDVVASVAQQMLSGVAWLHANHVVHRDLKPENLLFLYDSPARGNVLKIIDFGLACRCGEEEMLTMKVGTRQYMAPEVKSGKGYNRQCDMWSIGVVTFLMLNGYPLYADADGQALPDNMWLLVLAHGTKFWSRASKEAKRFVPSLLRRDPRDRPTSEKAIADKWVTFTAATDQSEKISIREGVAESIRRHTSTDKFFEAGNSVVATQLADVRVCKGVNAIAMDCDAKLYKEMRDGFEHCPWPESEMLEILKDTDANGNSAIEFTERIGA